MVTELLQHSNGSVLEWKWSTNSDLIPAPFWTSCFLIDGLLIDCAAPGSENEFREFIMGLNEEQRIEKCIITHHHEDHCGCAKMLQSEFSIPIFAGQKTVPLLKKKKEYPDYRQETWGYPYKPVDVKVIEDKIETCSNKYGFNILEIPGHSDDLIALIEKNQEWAFIHDGIMPKYTMIFGKSTDIPENISQIHNSINKLYDYTDGMENLLIFTAGRGIFKGRKFFLEKMHEIEELHIQAHELQKEAKSKGYTSTKAVRYLIKKMFNGESFVGKLTRGDLSNKNLIISLLDWPIE